MNAAELTMMTDSYQLTMMQGYFESGSYKKRTVFDLFYRKNPHENGFAIACGLEQLIEYISNIKFTDTDIEYLRSLNTYSVEFLDYLKDFRFRGTIHAVKEGTVVFPREPIVRVDATLMEAQLIETAILNIINHQSLIATKAARVVWAAQNDAVLEFGLRRAQGPDAGIYGARAAVIGGCAATSNVLSGKLFDIPISGTHAHSWVMSFPDELTAFREYCRIYPNNAILLVDTYDTLGTGVPNAITVFKEMQQRGVELKKYGIRLDSGDLAYLSKQARKMLDAEGFTNAIICASSDLDEYLINDLKSQGAKITLWGVGTNLIISAGCPSFGGVYKVGAIEDQNGKMQPKLKLSENPEKLTNPGIKKIIRLYDIKNRKIKADLIALDDEVIDTTANLTIFDEHAPWRRMTLKANEFYTRELLVPVFVNGECVYQSPSVMEIRDYCNEEKDSLWDEVRRFKNPHIVPVDLSSRLFKLKEELILSYRENIKSGTLENN